MKYRTLDELYAAVPAIACQGKCQQSCGPIGAFGVEVDQIEAAGQTMPGYRSQGGFGALTCTALTNEGRCAIYANRPLVCRLWGVLKSMPCPWGCKPDRVLSEREGSQMMATVAQLSDGRRVIAAEVKSIFER